MIFGKNQSIVAAFPRMPNDDDKKKEGDTSSFYAAIFEMEVDGRFLPLFDGMFLSLCLCLVVSD